MMKKGLVCMLMTCMVFALSGCSTKKLLHLQKEDFTIELGTDMSNEVSTYLNLDSLSEAEKEKVKTAIFNMEIAAEAKVSKEEKNYVKIGTYPGSITLDKEKVEFKVNVIDTTAPVITGLESIQLAKGQEFTYKDYYKASDLNDLEEMQFNTSAIDINTAGEYKLIVSIKDKAGNEAKKEVPVTILEVADNQESKSEIVTSEDGKQSYVTTVTDKPVEVVEAPANNTTNSNTQTSSNNGGNTAATPPTPQQPSYQEPSAPDTGSSSNSSDRTEGTCTLPAGNSGLLFDSLDEAINYAEKTLDDDMGELYRGYGTISACGKTTIQWKYK